MCSFYKVKLEAEIKPSLNITDPTSMDIVKGKETCIEAELVAAAKTGDRYAFEALILPLQSRLLRWLTRLTGDRAAAQEILQESLFKAFVSLSGFRGESSVATWLSRIAKNTYLTWRKQQERRPDQVVLDDDTVASEENLSDWPSCGESPESYLWQQELREGLADAIAALPETWRQALTLREEEGLSYDEIAQIQTVPIGTVRSRLHRARESLSLALHDLMEHV